MEMKLRRIGSIEIPDSLLIKEPGLMSRAFAEIGFVALRMENDLLYGAIKYTGYSEHFDELVDGCEIPTYRFEFHDDGKGTISIDLKK